MRTIEKFEKLIENGFSDEKLLIKERDIETISQNLQQFSNEEKTTGYTIPLVDTIGMNLYEKFSCTIKNI